MKPVVMDFLDSIEDDEELIKEFEKSYGSENLKYGKKLLKLYPERALEVYKKVLSEKEKCINDRNSYRYYANTLEDLAVVDIGRKYILENMEYLRSVYPSRRALKDELSKMLIRNGL